MNITKKLVKKISGLAAVAFMPALLAGCGAGDSEAKEFVIMEGTFSEMTILSNMAGELVKEYTDLEVSYHDGMSTVPFINALQTGEVDLGLSYDGTLLTTILGYDTTDIPEDESLYDWVNAKGKEDKGIMLTGNLGFENTYALAVPREFAEENGLKTISELQPYTSELIFGAEHEFFDEETSMRFKPMNKYYGLEWKDSKSMELSYKYTAIDNGNIDVTMVYTTDGLNVKSDLAILEDDRSFFPQYYGGLLVRDSVYDEYAETAPNLEEVLTMLNGKIDNETMTKMNYEVDAEGREPNEVAREFLIENGLIEE